MKKSKWLLLLSLVLVFALLVSCGPKNAPTKEEMQKTEESNEKDEAQTDAEQGKEEKEEQEKDDDKQDKAQTGGGHPSLAEGIQDGVIDVCIASEPESIDPALNTAVDGAVMLHHAFEGLIKWVDDGEGNAILAPGQAESWDVSEDGLTYTFHLRDGIKWSDGKDVTANDFVYAWNRLVNPDTGADYNYMLDMVEGFEDNNLNIKAVDDKTFEVKLGAFCPFFEEICAFPSTFPVRQDIVEGNDKWTTDPGSYVSNGPYIMKDWAHNSYILFEKNPDYYDADSLTANTIKFHLMDDHNAMYAAYLSGELDYIAQAPQEEIQTLLDIGSLKVNPQIGTYFVCFNTTEEPFDNPDVRKAFSLVIDRDYIVDKVAAQGQVPASGFVPSEINDAAGHGNPDFRTVGGDYYSMDPADYEKKCDEARELLKKAGFENGEGFPVVTYLYNTNDGHKAIGEALQNMWQEELNVTVNLQNQDWAVFQTERKEGNYSIARHGWIADYNDPMTFIDMWVSGSGNNDAQYNNPEFDKLVADAKAADNIEDRMKLMHEAEDLMVGEDAIVAPIYYYNSAYMLKPNIQGMYYTPLGYYFFGSTTGY
ncbi:MAG: peptide ABC transporter substrate-binding protein [Tissierellia bacterium]|nr:peptide ABC transporter substrate-binding protein [Tissierellia bacterium]